MEKVNEKNKEGKLPDKILAFDSSTRRGSLALFIPSTDEVIEHYTDINKVHSERLMPSLRFVLDQYGLSLSEIDMIAVAVGPGSFTGLRIALATAKGLSISKGIPVKGISTLEALAYNGFYKDFLICPIVDAGRSKIYFALYGKKSDKNLIEIIKPSCGTIDDIVRLLERRKNIFFTGNGICKYERHLKSKLKRKNLLFASEDLQHISAIKIARYAYERIRKGEKYDNVSTLLPLYLKPSDAEEKVSADRRV
ncbi:MAG: tRNA (adenosine(37)-N6)-threonylcarbamoyltransferase complex dimerization subunit type 1 TsaB [Candidatus Schekmanbacteria bacterium]|nr:MAG: tRNA (adenosine(37)-N6)-threonylcarbamoyltransferase complex dimerization subunit type 1 TsaB [Candidatus Schekmanbacteria bacterium]